MKFLDEMKFNLTLKIEKVLINPHLFIKLKNTGDVSHRYDDDVYLLWHKYPAFTDSNVEDIEFKFDCNMESIKVNKGE